MNQTILSVIVAGLFTSLAGSVAAQNVTAGDKGANTPAVTNKQAVPEAKSPKAVADPMQVEATPGEPGAKVQRPAKSSKNSRAKGTDPAAGSVAKADYAAAKEKARADYKEASEKCDALQGDATRTCMADAKAARAQALLEARTQWKGRKGGSDAGAGGMKGQGAEMKSDMRSDQGAASDTSKLAGSENLAQSDSAPAAGEEGQAIEARYEAAMEKCRTLGAGARRSCMTLAEKERKDALAKLDGQRDPEGGRLEKSRDDSIVPEAEKFQNVSTARKAPEEPGAGKANAN